MIVPAIAVKDELNKIRVQKILNSEYDYADNYGYTIYEIEFKKDIWHNHQIAIIEPASKKKEMRILGYADFTIEHPGEIISQVFLMAFEADAKAKVIIGCDLQTYVKDLFFRYNVSKMKWSVLVGNPIEKYYDRICKMCGGRIVGTFRKDTYTRTYVCCDVKWYEIMRKDFVNAISYTQEREFTKELKEVQKAAG